MANNTIAGANKIDDMGTIFLDVKEQTRAVLNNIKDVLATEGASMEDVVAEYLASNGPYKPYTDGRIVSIPVK